MANHDNPKHVFIAEGESISRMIAMEITSAVREQVLPVGICQAQDTALNPVFSIVSTLIGSTISEQLKAPV